MNRRICIMALSAMLALSAKAELDLNGMSLEKLYAVRDQVNSRIAEMEQGHDEKVYLNGTYCVGREIPEGDYVVFENEDAMFASLIVREDAAEDSGLVSHHIVNGQAVIRLNVDTWVTLSECRAYPLKLAPVSPEGPWGEGGYLVGATLPEGTYQCTIVDMAPLSSYSVYDGILGTDAHLTKFEVLREAATLELHAGEYIELSGCGLTITTSTEETEP